jgi:hypothetical protein
MPVSDREAKVLGHCFGTNPLIFVIVLEGKWILGVFPFIGNRFLDFWKIGLGHYRSFISEKVFIGSDVD